MKDWLLFEDPRFTLQFYYPAAASDGEPVELQETEWEGMLRVHILAPICREVYFEVSKYASLTPEGEYQKHRDYLTRQFKSLKMTALTATQCASLPALEYSFEWDQGIRRVLLVVRAHITYRILYNPRWPVNERIFSTVVWLDRQEDKPTS